MFHFRQLLVGDYGMGSLFDRHKEKGILVEVSGKIYSDELFGRCSFMGFLFCFNWLVQGAGALEG